MAAPCVAKPGQAAALPGTEAERQASTLGLDHTEVYPLLMFAVGGMLLAFGMVCGLLEAQKSGKGQVVAASMIQPQSSPPTRLPPTAVPPPDETPGSSFAG